MGKYQEVDQMIDQVERVVGQWKPGNKFLCMYKKLDELGDRVEEFDPAKMDQLAGSAKALNQDLDSVLRSLQAMDYANDEKNKIDFLYDVLEKAMENEDHVGIVLDRLTSLEKIHKEAPNIDGQISTLQNFQMLIDVTFQHEDAEIMKTKKLFLEAMHSIQIQLKEVTMLQKN